MTEAIFYIAAAIAIFSTLMVITRHHAVHALLYLVVSLLSLAVIFYLVGSPFAAALEVIIYAGAIMVLFIFVIMMLHLGKPSVDQEKKWLKPGMWFAPVIMTLILLIEVIIISTGTDQPLSTELISAREVGISLYSSYVIGVELAAILLLAGIVGAYHLGKEKKTVVHRFLDKENS
ncbi:MAG: NADH-quinone oxidoreductase subunit J [Fulvivirga sp.]|nr:NADH-quinone oxidoreductase subunit J [Fulvivirga sp.]